VVKPVINHPLKITINGWYKPSNMGWFIIVLTTLYPICLGYLGRSSVNLAVAAHPSHVVD
jgi:hypothetical protein